MQNSSRTSSDLDPKIKWLRNLIEECFAQNVSHSTIYEIQPESANGDYTSSKKWFSPDDDRWCPPTFDGFACWDATPPAAVAMQRCPGFVVGFDPKRTVYKSCTSNGTWYTRPDASKPWTNYTTCVDMEDLDFRSIISNVYVTGYSVSVAALLLSLIIFFYFRSLQCTRIRIHMHLFTSFALNNILWIVWYKAIVNEVTVVQDNEIWCQVLHVVTNYFMVTSFLWMFCEGLHLHIALVVVFVKDDVAMRWFVALGWGLSLVIIATYAAVRYYTPGATERCWMDQSDTFWIIVVPVLVSLISSFGFLVNVVRILVTKLHPAPNQRARLAARKAARAALILIPLFGLHFVLIPLHPQPGAAGEKAYQVFSALLTSLQVFVKDDVAMRWFVALGWGLSLVIIATYAAVRYYTPGATERCWMDQSDTFWIIVVPVLISLISSFGFLVNVVRILVTKLHPAPNQRARLAARKAARAALILIPLFGLHFVLIPLHPQPGAAGEKAYQVFSALLTSLQGLCVAFLFCFTNHDVAVAIRAHASRVLRSSDAIALTGLTAGESLVNTRENVV